MGLQLLLWFLALAFIFHSVMGENVSYINSEAEYATECKTCPHTLCPNTLFYESGDHFNTTCWTHGSLINDTSLWLQSTSSCYVTEFDLVDNTTDYTSVLPYCGPDSEDETLTLQDATLQYKTECRRCPYLTCGTDAWLIEDTNVTLTCWTAEGQVIIDDPYWMKTTNNCYVAQKNLYEKPDLEELDNCGPIPFLDSADPPRGDAKRDVLARDVLSPQYLINVTVGENYADCHSCPKEDCEVEMRYKFNQEVWLQCLVLQNTTWWSETTDFCYVKNSDFWQSPEGDYYKDPLCSYFEDPGSAPGGGDDK